MLARTPSVRTKLCPLAMRMLLFKLSALKKGHKAAAGEKKMSTNARNSLQEAVTEEFIGERRLWTAVVVMAVEDWRTGTLRSKREAQRFLFDDEKDFNEVCASAGLEPGCLRAKLLKIGHRVAMNNSWRDTVPHQFVA